MALSYRWRRGQLLVVNKVGIPVSIKDDERGYWLRWALEGLGWKKGKDGHSLFITMGTPQNRVFSQTLEKCNGWGRSRDVQDVDVKNLLEMKRLVIEENALRQILKSHQYDLQLPLIRKPKGWTTSATGMEVPREVERLSEVEMEQAVADTMTMEAATATAGSLGGIGMTNLSMDEVEESNAEAEQLLARDGVESDEGLLEEFADELDDAIVDEIEAGEIEEDTERKSRR